MSRLTVAEWEAEVRDHERELEALARPAGSCKCAPLMQVLEFAILRRLDGNVTREALENVEAGLRGLLTGQRERRWLREAICEMAEEFAEEFAEDVAIEAQAAYDEMAARREMATVGGE